MNIDGIVAQMRSYCPLIGGRVSGVADFAKGIETTANMVMPCAFVYQLEDIAGDNTEMNGLWQLVHERFAVCVIFDNSGSRTGYAGQDQVDPMKWAIFKSILNWRYDPERSTKGIQYDGGRLLDFDRARLFYQWEFLNIQTIDQWDGFIVDGPALTEIDLTNTGDGNAQMTTQRVMLES